MAKEKEEDGGQLNVRISKEQRERYEAAAAKEDRTLSNWVRVVLDRATAGDGDD